MTKILLLFNPHSGAGRAVRLAEVFSAALNSSGFITRAESILERTADEIYEMLQESELLVIIGGDVLVNSIVSRYRTCISCLYVVPAGNENLFSKFLRSSDEPKELIRRLTSPQKRTLPIGSVTVQSIEEGQQRVESERLFLCHVSVGFDAEVVRELAHVRSGGSSHLSYLLPFLRAFRSHGAKSFCISSEGRLLASGCGLAVFANTGAYALGIDMVPRNDLSSLDVCGAFYSIPGRTRLLKESLLAIFNRRLSPSIRADINEKTLTVTSKHDVSVQCDGEYLGALPITIRRVSDALTVLC